MSLFTLYAIFVLIPAIGIGLFLLAFVFVLAGLIELMGQELTKRARKFFTIALVCFIACVPFPSEKDIAIIMAAHYASNDETIAGLPHDVAAALKKYLADETE